MSNLEKEKPRKGKIIKEGIATMPTILDEETKEEVTRYKILIILNFTQFLKNLDYLFLNLEKKLHQMCQNVRSQQRKYWNCMRTWQRWKAKKIKRLMRMTKVIQPKMTISRKIFLYLYSFFIIIQDADIEDEKVTFLIGQHTDEEENEIPKHRQMIYDNNVQTKKKRRKKKKSKRKHSSFTEQELKVYVQTFAIKGLVYFELLCVKLYSRVLKMAAGPPKFSWMIFLAFRFIWRKKNFFSTPP